MGQTANLVYQILGQLYSGSTTRMAAAMGGKIKRQHIEHWLASGRVPWDHCATVERVTEGRWPCEELRPDLTWSRVRDRAWKWHRDGRPVIEASKAAA